jgi:TadE-like protein
MKQRLIPATFRRRMSSSRPGQAMLEMALVATLLLSLTFGIADVGLFMYDYVQAANCVRESARRAAVRAADAASPPYCISSDLSPVVPAGYMTLPAGAEVEVTLTKEHQWIAICYFVPGMSCTFDIEAKTSMRMEGQKL